MLDFFYLSVYHCICAVFEVWLSLVERYVRDVEVACSNHVTSIKTGIPRSGIPVFLSCNIECQEYADYIFLDNGIHL